jgi:hypothetical protein
VRYAPERGERTPFGIVLRCTGFLANRYGEPRWLPRVREHPPVRRDRRSRRTRIRISKESHGG